MIAPRGATAASLLSGLINNRTLLGNNDMQYAICLVLCEALVCSHPTGAEAAYIRPITSHPYPYFCNIAGTSEIAQSIRNTVHTASNSIYPRLAKKVSQLSANTCRVTTLGTITESDP